MSKDEIENIQSTKECLFTVEDFTSIPDHKSVPVDETKYPGLKAQLKSSYNKVEQIKEKFSKLNYCVTMRNDPTERGTYYSYYQWCKIHPIFDDKLLSECRDRVYFVVSILNGGFEAHLDYRSSNIKDVWQPVETDRVRHLKDEVCIDMISPQDAARYSIDELVEMVDKFIKQHTKEYLLLAQEFKFTRAIQILKNMALNEYTELLKNNHNMILTGAPGTGKTYVAKKIAEAMGAEWKLIQFHPSYDYTDFIEGLRPFCKGNELGFQRKDGVFKDFCKKAIISFKDIEKEFHTLEDRVKKEEIIDLETCSGARSKRIYSKKDGIFYYKRDGEPKQDIAVSLKTLKKVYDHGINCLSKLKKAGTDRSNLGVKGDTTGIWAVYNYILSQLKYVFIIDEINRGEISKIFGELFYSVDPGYRGKDGIVETQYQNLIPKEGDENFDEAKADIFRDGFYIPENVYIIGTMNDIDRSVESLDFAMRRRFAWKEITAKARQNMLDEDDAWGTCGKPSQDIIDEIKIRMDNLNDAIIDRYGNEILSPKDKIGLSKAYQIGASYFLKYNKYNNFDELWENHLVGLLYEYLRGTTNVDAKIDRLKAAYNDTIQH